MFSHVAAALVGAVLAYAGARKLTAFDAWLVSARLQDVAKVVAILVPPVELILGALLVAFGPQILTLALSTLLLLAFTAFLMANIIAKNTAPCACFGSASTKPARWRDVARNLALITLLVLSAATA